MPPAPTGRGDGPSANAGNAAAVSSSSLLSSGSSQTSTASSTPSSSVLVGAVGTYALLEVIGKGAYGTVHKGIWRERGRHVAIKRVARARLPAEEEAALSAEIDLFKHLKHENIVNYVEAIGAPDSPFLDIVMEYVEGGSLYSIVQKIRNSHSGDAASSSTPQHVFPERTVASFVAQVARGLDYLHQQGVVHRDIKGANILVTKNSDVKLADFGVSTKRGTDAHTASSKVDVAGTPYWMAPEIITLSGCSTASDIWSVGCTVIELLTGFPPYHELSDVTALFRIVTDECPPLPTDVSHDCQNFLRACFTKDMNARATARDLLSHPWLGLEAGGRDVSAAGDEAVGGGGGGASGDGDGGDAADDPWLVSSAGELAMNGGNEGDGLNQYEEAEDEGFGDDDFDFGDEEDGGGGGGSGGGGGGGLGDLGGAASGVRPARGADAVEAEDPFSGMMADPEAEKETERLRKHRELWQRVMMHASALGGSSVDAHVSACNSLVDIFASHPEQRYSLIYDPGLLPILEVLESGGGERSGPASDAVVEAMLRVALSLLDNGSRTDGAAPPPVAGAGVEGGDGRLAAADEARGDGGEEAYLGYPRVANIRHDMCLAGFLPAVIQYCDRTHPTPSRVLAALFIEEMLRLESTLHMFAACRGFTVFVDMLEPDLDACGELPRIALDGIETLLSMEKQRHKRDFCRRFAWCGLLDRIVKCVDFSTRRLARLAVGAGNVPGHAGAAAAAAAKRHRNHIVKLARLLQTFAARADPSVKAKMSVPTVIAPIIQHIVSPFLPGDAVQPILCCVRDLSRDPQTHAALQAACAIDVLVQYLSGCPRTEANTKARHYIISCLHNLCIVSPARQEAAASTGLVPHLQTYIRSNDINLRSLCIDMYSGLACSGHKTRVELSKHAGVDFYVELLLLLSVPGTVRKWQARVLQSLAEWLEDETQATAVEDRLVQPRNCGQMCQSLAQMRVADVEAVLEPYLHIILASQKVNGALGQSRELVSAMVSWLEQMYLPTAGAVGGGPRGRLLLLQILLAHARVWLRTAGGGGGGGMSGLVAALRVLLTESVLVVEEAITVREQASRLLDVLDGKNA
jgi:hypothetical protein